MNAFSSNCWISCGKWHQYGNLGGTENAPATDIFVCVLGLIMA